MDKNSIVRGEIVSDSGKMYSVIGVLGTVLYIQEIDAGNKTVDYQLKEIELLFRKGEAGEEEWDEESMLEASLIIGDECSMIDMPLMGVPQTEQSLLVDAGENKFCFADI